MDYESIKDIDDNKNQNNTVQVLLLGLLAMFAITSVGILHTNEKEFIQLIYPSISNFQISFYDTIIYISYLTVGIITGILSDRYGKRKLFIIVGSIGASLFSWLLTIAPNYPVLLTFRFFQGSFIVLSWQTLMTLILDLSSPQSRGRNMGIYGVFLSLAMGLGPMLGGFLAVKGIFIPYYIAVILNALVLIVALVILREPQNLNKNPSIIQNLSIVKNNPKLVIPSIFNFIDRLHMGFILFALPLLILDVLGLDPSKRGMALGIFAIPFILLQYPIGKLSDKIGRFKPLVIGSFFYGIIMCFVGFAGSFGFISLVAILFVLGIFSGITSPPNMALVGDCIRKEDRAMGMGFFNFVGNLGIIIGPLIGGALVNTENYVIAFIIAGIIEFLGLIVVCVIIIYKYHIKIFEKPDPQAMKTLMKGD